MQKIAISQIIREEVLRALIFALAFFILMISGIVGVAHAADGWLFGNLLNTILVKAWDDPTNDGTVKNANKLGWSGASDYVRLGTNRSCGSNQCIYGIETDGDVLCQ